MTQRNYSPIRNEIFENNPDIVTQIQRIGKVVKVVKKRYFNSIEELGRACGAGTGSNISALIANPPKIGRLPRIGETLLLLKHNGIPDSIIPLLATSQMSEESFDDFLQDIKISSVESALSKLPNYSSKNSWDSQPTKLLKQTKIIIDKELKDREDASIKIKELKERIALQQKQLAQLEKRNND